jgi:hypothetical protein
MANRNALQAYVRFDGTGRVIPGSLILNRFKPQVGNWKQIGSYECCDPFCLPPVYGEDYIVDDIIEGETGLTFVILTNPFTNPILEVCLVSCESDPPSRIITLQVELVQGNTYYYFVPGDVLSQACALGFRRICEATQSGWDLAL